MDTKIISEVKEKVKNYINKADPWYLIEISAPPDEYNSQTDHIVSFLLNEKPNQNDLESELFKTFKTNEFELDENKIKGLAKNILTIEC